LLSFLNNQVFLIIVGGEAMAEEERLISEFNEAKFQIFRLHNIWLECKQYREKGFINQWRWKLDTAMIELWNDARRLDGEENKDESEEEKKSRYVNQLKKLNKKISEKIKDKKMKELYECLTQKEIILREIQERAGKGARYRAADEDYM
jgi:hypothetical protein